MTAHRVSAPSSPHHGLPGCLGRQTAKVTLQRHSAVTEPGSIRSVADLQAYVRRCKAHYWGHSDDTRFLHWLIEREVQSLTGR